MSDFSIGYSLLECCSSRLLHKISIPVCVVLLNTPNSYRLAFRLSSIHWEPKLSYSTLKWHIPFSRGYTGPVLLDIQENHFLLFSTCPTTHIDVVASAVLAVPSRRFMPRPKLVSSSSTSHHLVPSQAEITYFGIKKSIFKLKSPPGFLGLFH